MKKVLSAVGGFFAKIGRWIANTAWIQPLLIVGGIFAVIFSIPYIKQGFESIAANTEDSDVVYYTDRAISLTGALDGTSKVDQLFTALEANDAETIKATYGSKFFLSFVKEDCAYCKECVAGYQSFASYFNTWALDKVNGFRLYTVMVDTTDDDGNYLAKSAFEHHQNLFDDIVAEYTEANPDKYALANNISSTERDSLKDSIEKLENAIDNNGEGLETPTTFMIDLTGNAPAGGNNVHGVTAIFFNYVDYLSTASYETNSYGKGKFLSDCWNYEKLFSLNYKQD